jgi:hypothetical protein
VPVCPRVQTSHIIPEQIGVACWTHISAGNEMGLPDLALGFCQNQGNYTLGGDSTAVGECPLYVHSRLQTVQERILIIIVKIKMEDFQLRKTRVVRREKK